MKGWPIRIIVCLILGAITTVAVAWGNSPCRSAIMEAYELGAKKRGVASTLLP